MEGRFQSGPAAGIALIGQPNVRERRLDNPIELPGVLSLLAYGTFHSDVRGLGAFPEDTWPDNIELLYYSFHIMAGLGAGFIATMALAGFFFFFWGLGIKPLVFLVFFFAIFVSFFLYNRGCVGVALADPTR